MVNILITTQVRFYYAHFAEGGIITRLATFAALVLGTVHVAAAASISFTGTSNSGYTYQYALTLTNHNQHLFTNDYSRFTTFTPAIVLYSKRVMGSEHTVECTWHIQRWNNCRCNVHIYRSHDHRTGNSGVFNHLVKQRRAFR